MAQTTILVKFPGQPLCYMDVPTDQINHISRNISGLQNTDVDFFSLYGNFYYIIMSRDQNKNKLPFNITVFFADSEGITGSTEVHGTFVICKLPKGLTQPLSNMTVGDATEVVKLLKK